MTAQWTTDDIDDQQGRVVVITGANSGIGLEAAKVLVEKGAHVVMACRSPKRADEALEELPSGPGSAEVMVLDLADQSSVDGFAKEFCAAHSRLDVLINNAGVMAVPKAQTVDGFERQLGTNHLGHFALTGRLLDPLLATADSRVVTISSIAHRAGRMNFDDLFYDEGGYNPQVAYGQSKLANLLFALELDRRLEGRQVQSLAAHPGVSATELAEDMVPKILYPAARLLMKVVLQSAARGALPTLRAALDTTLPGGSYIGPKGPGEVRGRPVPASISKQARSAENAERLWQASVELTGVDYAALD